MNNEPYCMNYKINRNLSQRVQVFDLAENLYIKKKKWK